MSRETMQFAEICAKSKDAEGFKRNLQLMQNLPENLKNSYMAELALNVMADNWTKGLDIVLSSVGNGQFPNQSIRDGISYYTTPLNEGKAGELFNLLRIHEGRLTPEVKADISFEMGPYMSPELTQKGRSFGLMEMTGLSDTYRPKLHGALTRHGGDGAKMADALLQAPETVRERVYAKMAKEPSLDFYSSSFKEAIKDDPEFQKAFEITPAIQIPQEASLSINQSFEPVTPEKSGPANVRRNEVSTGMGMG